ncbi:unnamed protein product [Colias eurytheme]|nr:unnamed protein product [Colias eurytheme]
MEIRALYCYVIFNCFLMFPSFDAKTFSLNEAIAAEARNQDSIKLPRVPDTLLKEDYLPSQRQRNRVQAQRKSSCQEINLNEIQKHRTQTTLFAIAPIDRQLNHTYPARMKRQLFPRLSPMRSRLGLSPLPRLPPRRPIVLPLITNAISDGIRTYPYYLQEIPLALSETLMGSVREAAPQISNTLKELSPGIIEIMNTIPEAQSLNPLQKIVKRIPTVIQETVQAMNPEEDYEQRDYLPKLQLEKETKMLNSFTRPSQVLKETYLSTKNKINSQIEESKRKAQNFYQNMFQEYKDLNPITKQKLNKQKKKIMPQSSGISPVLSESLTEIAQIPQKIKNIVEQMKQ